MASLEELKAQIAAAQNELADERRLEGQLIQESSQANERQRMRRELDEIRAKLFAQKRANAYERELRIDIDRDEDGEHMPSSGQVSRPARRIFNSASEVTACNESVVKAEYLWKIEGMSWLVNALKQAMEPYAIAPADGYFSVGVEEFEFVYNPRKDLIISSTGSNVSLGIIHHGHHGITFRYKIFVKGADEQFVQWGDTGDECHPELNTFRWVFGPDVQRPTEPGPWGIFGLSHEELLESEWVDAEDALTVKFLLEVRQNTGIDSLPVKHAEVEVPPSSICANLLALLDDGKCSDVTFIVQGQRIKAHSQILAARSEVFERELSCGMRESLSKEIAVEDCDVAAFRALLRFLYSDDFGDISEMLKTASVGDSSSSSPDDAISSAAAKVDKRTVLLQGVLAASHRYQVSRLQLWCEQQLCRCISVNEVCSVLVQAHLYEAKQLQKVCLQFIKENMDSVVVTPAYVGLIKEWPQLMLKISTFVAGVSETSTAALLAAHQETMRSGSGKRKRSE